MLAKLLFPNALLVALVALVLSSCGSKTQKETSVSAFADFTVEEHEEKLRARHAERWAAVIKVDFDEVYEYATPEYRGIYSKTHLHNQYGAQIRRKSARIVELKFDDADPKLAHIKTGLTFATVTPSGSLYEDEVILNDKWRFSQGYWWFVEPR